MNLAERNRLTQEAALQTKALGQIEGWRKMALALSAVGVAFVYAGYAGEISRYLGHRSDSCRGRKRSSIESGYPKRKTQCGKDIRFAGEG